MAPQFPIQTETAHAAEFILSEAPGHYSRDNAKFADPSTIRVAQPVKQSVAPTTDLPGVYIPAVTGADCLAIAIYGGVSSSGYDLLLSVLTRNAEVNGKLISWPANFDNTAKAAGITALATKGIIVR